MHSIIWQNLKIKTVTLSNVFRRNHIFMDEYASFSTKPKHSLNSFTWDSWKYSFKIETRKERLNIISMPYQSMKEIFNSNDVMVPRFLEIIKNDITSRCCFMTTYDSL